MASCIYRERSTTADGIYQPYWGSVGLGLYDGVRGAWTYTPNSSWVNDLRGGAAPNLGFRVSWRFEQNSWQRVPRGYSVNTGISTPGLGLVCLMISGRHLEPRPAWGIAGGSGTRGTQYQLDFTDKVSYLHGNQCLSNGATRRSSPTSTMRQLAGQPRTAFK